MKARKGQAATLSPVAYRVPEVALLLGLGLTKVKELLRVGDLGHIKQGKATLITKKQLLTFLREKEQEAGFISPLSDDEVYG